jgi:hypothetical protein
VPGEVVALPRRNKSQRTVDVVRDAFDRGCPSPLAAMLDNLAYWHHLANDLDAGDPESQILSRVARMQSQRCAVDAAQFIHPKLSATQVSGDPDHPLFVAPAPSPFADLTEQQAQLLLDRIGVLDEQITTLSAIPNRNADQEEVLQTATLERSRALGISDETYHPGDRPWLPSGRQ